MVIDTTTEVIHAALRGLAARQRAIAQNIANLEVPGYIAQRVTFEDSLRLAIGRARPDRIQPTTTFSTAPRQPNGNNVSLDEEIVTALETSVRYQLMTEAASRKFGILRTAIGRR